MQTGITIPILTLLINQCNPYIMTFVEQSLVGHLRLQYQFIMIVIAIVNISRSTNCLFQICICFAGIGKYIIRTMCILSHIHITVISTGSLDLQSLHERYVILYRSGCLKCLVIGLTIPYDIRVGHGYYCPEILWKDNPDCCWQKGVQWAKLHA